MIKCKETLCQRYYNVPADILRTGANANALVFVDTEGVSNLPNIKPVISVLQ
eukprot:NODE_6385_length_284_cov_230.480851_g5773_i0.p1 GENE.NODE_6385_length_284_cov_230.480851_g5773_i0~~NODE_6385_length_284_cov_230.480851_g5773_i0.p1  ORF type:complete len:52 (-),score=3.95 NODE_6385_length_284_cov_230.480851_g5773_i0:49-204(-)